MGANTLRSASTLTNGSARPCRSGPSSCKRADSVLLRTGWRDRVRRPVRSARTLKSLQATVAQSIVDAPPERHRYVERLRQGRWRRVAGCGCATARAGDLPATSGDATASADRHNARRLDVRTYTQADFDANTKAERPHSPDPRIQVTITSTGRTVALTAWTCRHVRALLAWRARVTRVNLKRCHPTDLR